MAPAQLGEGEREVGRKHCGFPSPERHVQNKNKHNKTDPSEVRLALLGLGVDLLTLVVVDVKDKLSSGDQILTKDS